MQETQPWWRGGIIYQIYPRSFCDSTGNGIGDLKGITSKLDYVASLGVDGIWLSPFFSSPMADFGYDVSDYQNIDPIFGTLDDCDEMIREMHKRKLKLIVDLVLNHTSEKHPWFTESRKSRSNPKSDWYVWADPKPDGTPPNNWMSVFGGSAWQFDSRRGQYYYHQFLKEQPDLNIRNPEVQDALLGIMKWWLDRGVHGFRLDALNHCIHDAQLRDNPPHEGIDLSGGSTRYLNPYSMQWHRYDKSQPEMIPFLKKIRALTDQYPDCMTVAEINDDTTVKTTISYTGSADVLHTAYNFSMLGPVYGAKVLRAVLDEFFAEPHNAWPSWAFSNHDIARVASRWAVDGKPDMAQAKMLIALLTSFRGTAFIYEGEELGLTEADIPFEKLQDPYGIFLWPEDKGRDGCRTPMPWDGTQKNAGFSQGADTWLPIPPEHTKNAVAAQEKDAHSTLNFTRTLLKWRKTIPALRHGTISFTDVPEPLIAFQRSAAQDDVFCAFNLGPQPVTLQLPFPCTALNGHGLPFSLEGETLSLPGFGGFFGSKK